MADAQREAIEIAREQTRAELLKAQELQRSNALHEESITIERDRNTHLQHCATVLDDLQFGLRAMADDIAEHRALLTSMDGLLRQVVIPSMFAVLRNGRSQTERDSMVTQLMALAERLGTSRGGGVNIEHISGDLAGNVAAGKITTGDKHGSGSY